MQFTAKMDERESLRKGFIPVMLTPFRENGEIDYDMLTKLTLFYLKAGAAGLFANCLSSEMYELTGQERLNIASHIIDIVKGAVPVVATGTFGNTIGQQADFVKRMYDKGVQAVILITSLLANEDEPGGIFSDRVFELLDSTLGIPVGFYECPVPYKRLLTPPQLKLFVATGRVIYHKDTSLNIENIREKLKAVQGYDFGLYDAYMGHVVDSLKAGAAGLSCIQGNFFPGLIAWLCENYNNRLVERQMWKVQHFFLENMNVMHHVYPTVAKYCLQKRGLSISSFTRRQVGVYTPSLREEIELLYKEGSSLEKELNIRRAV